MARFKTVRYGPPRKLSEPPIQFSVLGLLIVTAGVATAMAMSRYSGLLAGIVLTAEVAVLAIARQTGRLVGIPFPKFSLVELLVLIGWGWILAALIVPVR